MSFTYLLATSVGQIRLLIPDTIQTTAFFSDEEITAILGLEYSRVKRAAAACLEVLASNEAYVQKNISLLDLSTNGPSVAAELRARAKALRAQDAEDLVLEQATEGDASFEISEWPLGPASRRDYVDRLMWGTE